MGVPSVPIITQRFQELVTTTSFKKGIPNMRIVYAPHPVTNRPAALCRKYIEGKDPNTKPFVEELFAALKAKYPKTTWVLRDKLAGYMDDDPKLWAEIKEKGAGAIVLLGH